MAINSQLCSNLFSPRCNDKNCRIQVAGGAYTYTTTAAASIRWKIRSFNFFFCNSTLCFPQTWENPIFHVATSAGLLFTGFAFMFIWIIMDHTKDEKTIDF